MIKINGIARLMPISVGVLNRPQFPEAPLFSTVSDHVHPLPPLRGCAMPALPTSRMFAWLWAGWLPLHRARTGGQMRTSLNSLQPPANCRVFNPARRHWNRACPRRGIVSSYSNVPLVSKRRQPRLLVSGIEIATVDATHSFRSRKYFAETLKRAIGTNVSI
jgi:hypothetical protein